MNSQFSISNSQFVKFQFISIPTHHKGSCFDMRQLPLRVYQ